MLLDINMLQVVMKNTGVQCKKNYDTSLLEQVIDRINTTLSIMRVV